MVYITVGYVAGFIAAGISVARIWSPAVLTFILSGILGDRNSAATWTVAARALERTHWPDVLRSDSAKNHGVRKSVVFLTKVISLMGLLIVIAGVITPLGLYQTLEQAHNIQTPFKYLKDTSPFGFGTPPRSNYSFNRECGFYFPIPCPFSDTVAISATTSDGNANISYPHGYDISIPAEISTIYSSGVSNDTTISNFFDIQWRQYVIKTDTSTVEMNNGSNYLVQGFRGMQSMVLNNAVQPVEGLIVDTVNGGIGFRNHTVPPGFQYGATWQEDLLFIEPETVCVDTNTTIDYTIGTSLNSTNPFNTLIDLVLTDRGGFVNINHIFPVANLSNPQENPDLWTRAYKAAWMANTYTMLYFNITNPRNDTTGRGAFAYLNTAMGKTFPLVSLEQSNYDSLGMDSSFDVHLNFNSGGFGNSSDPVAGGQPNPFDISGNNFTDIGLLCAGAGGDDYANITNIYVKCGLMRGIPQRQDGGSSILFDPGSQWSQHLYACASSVKATVKTVSFLFNGTDELQNLKITDVHPKNYSDQSSLPLWGVENTGNQYTLDELSMIWGLISSNYENSPNVSTVRQESLYLTGYYDGSDIGIASIGTENLPASDFYSQAMDSAYLVGPLADQPVDYSGENNMALWARWQTLTNSTASASLVPNLIFTDYAAAAVVGTKGVLGPGNTAAQNVVPLLVTPTISVIRYHWPFAIPALIAALGLLFFTALAVITMVCRRHNIGKLRNHLNLLSPGRIFTTFMFPESGAMGLSAYDWNKRMGNQMVDLSGDFPDGVDASGVPEKPIAVSGYQSVSGEHSAEGVGFLNSTAHAHQNPESHIGAQGFSQGPHSVPGHC